MRGSGTLQRTTKASVLDFTQAGAIQNTWYTAAQLRDAEFSLLAMGCTVANETLEMRITIDGQVWNIAAGVAVTATQYSIMQQLNMGASPTNTFTCAASNATVTLATTSVNYVLWLKGRSVQIEVRKTTAGGASALRVIGLYGQW